MTTNLRPQRIPYYQVSLSHLKHTTSLSLSFLLPLSLSHLLHPTEFSLFPIPSVSSPLWRRSLSLLFSPLSSLVFLALPTLICFLSLGRGAYCNPRLFDLLLLAKLALAVPSAVKPVIPNDRC
jgi:hypothetical protein